MYEYVISKRSKLKNFAPKISSCVQLIVLSVRNANIVMPTNRQTGIYRWDLVRQGFDKNLYPHTFCCHTLRVHDTVWRMGFTRALLSTPILQTIPWVMLEHHCANKRKKHKKHNVADGWSHLFVFFFVFSDYGRVLCTNKRLYVRLSRTGSRKT